ncbi:MAG: GNAT family N-acetyltransferase [Bacteroidales bacterium]|nr:GNAT family N-acetyltransferase [Bacteroidales bacterium]
MGDICNLQIVKAEMSDHFLLTDIAFKAKRHWPYPEIYFKIWKDELTITSDYISKNLVFKAIAENKIVAFYSVTENKKGFFSGEVFVQRGFWLEHIFVLPAYHHKGIGTAMIRHLKTECKSLQVEYLLVFADPYAKGFYDRIGAGFLYASTSSVPGRKIPVYRINIS